MHELSIALSIIEGAEEEMLRQGCGRVTSVMLKLGPLSGVVKEALLFSYDLACAGTLLEGSSLAIEEIPIRIECTRCGGERGTRSPQHLECEVCGGSGPVVSGTELQMFALEVQT